MNRREARWAGRRDDPPGNEEGFARTLNHCKTDADLAGIRDAKVLAQLPEGERFSYKQLRSDVDHLLTKAAAGK